MSGFVKFFGHCSLAGKQIAVYKKGNNFVLKAETIGGGPIKYSYTDENGQNHWATVRPLVINEKDYEDFEEQAKAGSVNRSDEAAVMRGLIAMGYPADSFGAN